MLLASKIVNFMLLAMDRVGADLQDPFENRAHDVPLTSLSRTIQIDLVQVAGAGSGTLSLTQLQMCFGDNHLNITPSVAKLNRLKPPCASSREWHQRRSEHHQY